jgi:hypothetical protein
MDAKLTEPQLEELHQWVGAVPLSRPGRNLYRGFSDGVLMAKVAHHFYPRIIDLHESLQLEDAQQKSIEWPQYGARY